MKTAVPAAIAWLCLTASAAAAGLSPPMPVILDTDIGTDIDDAWALAFVVQHRGFAPLGVTISDADTPARARVACKLLERARRSSLPVAVGRRTETPKGRVDYQFAWAEDFSAVAPIAQPAAEFIVEQARRHPGQITLIAVGPLQNVADALRLEPNLGRLLKRVVLMSGCIRSTAQRPSCYPEWNVKAAIADAQLVYAAGLPLTIVPLDATTHVLLDEAERRVVRDHGSPLTHALEALYRLWMRRPESRMMLHDQLAVAEAARPGELFGRQEVLALRVDDQGQTLVDEQSGRPVTVCFDPKRDAFMSYYIAELTSEGGR
jgi:purine nucleosidase